MPQKLKILTDAEVIANFGQPIAPGSNSNLIQLSLPYPMRIAWDKKVIINKLYCHKKIATPLQAVFTELLNKYGLAHIQHLGIDLFGGLYNYRKMRGSTTRWSRHSWAIAIDLDPDRNGLHTKKPKAQFSKSEYKTMIDIFYKNGFVGYGPEKDYDWMHFEYAKIENLKK
jgi:D-alanyl-D-alanine carboxypeptidase